MNELATKQGGELSTAIEQTMIQGDLSKLNPQQRVEYYNTVCRSMGLNPYTKPFDYINLNGKLTLYARKDAADQLRRINGVSIDSVEREIVDGLIIVTAKGHDASGRNDVEIGVVSTKDMSGNMANALMKANTKAKRRLTLSLCGLGWLDETEVETIPEAKPVIVDDNGVIEGTPVIEATIENKAAELQNPNNNIPVEEKPAEAQEKPEFDEVAHLKDWTHKITLPGLNIKLMSTDLETACETKTSKGKLFGKCETSELFMMWNAYMNRMKRSDRTQEEKDDALMKLSAINEILTARKSAQEQLEKQGA